MSKTVAMKLKKQIASVIYGAETRNPNRRGLSSSEACQDKKLCARIDKARKAGASFSEIEKTFSLKESNGMVAFRIVNRKR